MLEETRRILIEALQLGSRGEALTTESPILGAIPEFDSMAVVTVLTIMEEKFGVEIDDAEISAEIFETLGTLSDFLQSKVNN